MSSNCKECGGYLGNGAKVICWDCTQLAESADEVDHDDRVRCPKCRKVFEVTSEDSAYYADGEHVVNCVDCNYLFEVSTHVSCSYTSPALLAAIDAGRARAKETK